MDRPDRRALRNLRINYFARFGALAFLFPFINLFYRRHDLSGAQIGLIATIGAFSALIAAPIWGRLSDVSRHRRRLLQLAMAGSSLFIFILGQQTIFGWMAVFVCLDSLAQAGIDPLSDNLAVALTRGQRYGSIRLWGSLGWAVMVLIAGWLIERLGTPVIFAGYGASLIIAALILNFVPHSPFEINKQEALPLYRMVGDLIRNRSALGLFIALAFSGLSSVALQIFEPIFIDQLGAGETIIGLAYTIAALAEPAAMLWADRHIGVYSAGGLLRLGLLLSAIRIGLVVVWPIVPVLVAGHLLEGIGFALRQVSVVIFVTRSTPDHQGATVLALYGTMLYSLTQMLGAPLAGLIFDFFGAYWLFCIALAGQIIAWLVVWFALPRQDKPSVSD